MTDASRHLEHLRFVERRYQAGELWDWYLCVRCYDGLPESRCTRPRFYWEPYRCPSCGGPLARTNFVIRRILRLLRYLEHLEETA